MYKETFHKNNRISMSRLEFQHFCAQIGSCSYCPFLKQNGECMVSEDVPADRYYIETFVIGVEDVN